MIAQIILIITLANLLLSMSQQNLRATQEEVVYADAATNKSELTFFLLGDWGKGGLSGNVGGKNKKDKKNRHKARKLPNDNDNEHNQHDQKDESTYQVQIARAMGNLSSEDPPQFVIALGDNFYDDGVSSVNDTLWNSLWKDIYIKNFTGLNIPWYGVLGNHDYGSGTNGVKAQVARTSFGDDDFWTMPDTNYSKTFGIPNTNDSVMFVFCDTTTLAPSENECCNEEG